MTGFRWTAALLLLLLLLAPAASAQANAMYRLTFEGVPTEPVHIRWSASQGLSLKLVVQNVICTSASNFVAAVSATLVPKAAGNTTENASVVVSKPSITLTIPQGAHASQVEKSDTFALNFLMGPNLTADAEYNVALAASIPATSGTECREASPSARSPITGSGTMSVVFEGAKPIELTPGPRLPVPPALALVGLLVAALFTQRLRRA